MVTACRPSRAATRTRPSASCARRRAGSAVRGTAPPSGAVRLSSMVRAYHYWYVCIKTRSREVRMNKNEATGAGAARAGSGGHRSRAGRGAEQRRVLTLACAAQFMVVLDVAVVNVALPSIRDSLGFGLVSPQWVGNAYSLAFAGLLLLGGRLADVYGRRRAFLGGLVLFAAASLVGGLAIAPGTLMAARAAQGLGAAVLAPATLTVLTTTFAEGPERTRAFATWT